MKSCLLSILASLSWITAVQNARAQSALDQLRALTPGTPNPPPPPRSVPVRLDLNDEERRSLLWIDGFIRERHINRGQGLDGRIQSEDFFSTAKSMLQSLDTHSRFLDAQEAAQLEADAAGDDYVGIGIIVGKKAVGEPLKIKGTFPDSPASKEGLKSGDIVLEITDARFSPVRAADLDLDGMIRRFRGPQGSQAQLKIRRPNPDGTVSEFDVALTREAVASPVMRAAILENTIGYIHLQQWSAGSTDLVMQVLEKLTNEGMRSLIFDVRDNPGGFLDEVVAIASLFLRPDDLVVTIKSSGGKAENWRANDAGAYVGLPVAVLINENSQSGSEIFAGAIQDHGQKEPLRAVIGRPSLGKGSRQTIFRLGPGSVGTPIAQLKTGEPVPPLLKDCALKLTTDSFFTPKGHPVEGVGIQPTILLPAMSEAASAELSQQLSDDLFGVKRNARMTDPAIDAALKILR
ncbi:MAG: S41 family peptidase [Elusimicrobiota bacterium]